MRFEPGTVEGSYLVHLEPRKDERGFFARGFCREEFAAHGLDPHVEQANLSGNVTKGTLRGLHWQEAPHAETKFIRCTSGAVWDVVVDIRPDSPTYRKWFAAELTADNRVAMYAPKGTAHGYLTLSDEAEVLYLVSAPFVPAADRGARWDDPAFAIDWPFAPTAISPKDAAHADFVVTQDS